jgi:predicted PurR-regulated permease PerM
LPPEHQIPPRATNRSRESRAKAPAAESGGEPLPLHPGTRRNARVILAVVLTGLAIWIAREFLAALIWAAMLAIALWPLYERAGRKTADGPSTVRALLFTLAVAVLVFLPLALVTYEISQQSAALASAIAQWRKGGLPVPDWAAHLPVAADAVTHWWRENLANPASASAWLQKLNADGVMQTFGVQLIDRLFMLFVSLIVLFILLRRGNEVARHLLETAERLLGEPGENLVAKTVDAIRGTVNGAVVIAVMEGILIAPVYVIAGVPDPALFAILTAAFAMLPFGAWAVFSAAALALVATGGSGLAAAGVVAWGALVMIGGDQFVFPTLVGGAARLPFVFAFVGIFGGLATFGLIGLFLGPVIMAAFLTVWREWIMRSKRSRT